MYLTLLVTLYATSRVCKFTIKSWVIFGKPAACKVAAVNVILSPTSYPAPKSSTNTLYLLFWTTDTVNVAAEPLPSVLKVTSSTLTVDVARLVAIGCCDINTPSGLSMVGVNIPSWLTVSAQNQVSPSWGKLSSDKKLLSRNVWWLNHCILKK